MMETNSSPHTAHPYMNKIIHADIRVESIDESVGYPVDNSQNSSISQSKPTPEDVAARERAAEMQMWWDEAIAKNMNLPDGYKEVAVLIIKWADQLDELKTMSEALELQAVFRESFHYQTEIVELDVSSKPQHQMSEHLARFIRRHDGPNHLMIVYYTGHGVHDGKSLQLTGSTNPMQKKGFSNEAKANWDRAEEALRSDDIEGDVLTILDTCYSSNLQKSGKEDTRTFELLSACAFDQTTASPGENSFTRALIDALKELLVTYPDRSFTTFHLNQRILLNPNRRDTPSQLWHRLKHHERHIRLAPLQPEKERRRKPSLPHPPKGYLTLRFALRDDSLNREQIEYLTRNLSKAFSNKALVGLRRIDWLGLKPARTTHFGRAALAMFAIAQWKKFVKKRRAQKQQNRTVDDISIPVGEFVQEQMVLGRTESATSSPTRKRIRDDVDELPDAKRELLVIPQLHANPPSPPNSDISRGEDGYMNEAR